MSQLIADPEILASLQRENDRLLEELAVLRQHDQRYRAILTSATEYAFCNRSGRTHNRVERRRREHLRVAQDRKY